MKNEMMVQVKIAEEIIISNMLDKANYLKKMVTIFDKECFSNEKYQNIFIFCKQELASENNVTISQISQACNISHQEIRALIDNTYNASLESYEKILLDYGKSVKFKKIMLEAMELNRNEGFYNASDFISQKLNKSTVIYDTNEKIALENLDDYIKNISSRKNKKPYIKTGFNNFDNQMQGLQKKKLYCLGATSSGGKSSFALQISNHVGMFENVYYLSLEMDYEEVCDRLLCQQSKVQSYDLMLGKTEKLDREKCHATKININFSSGIDVDDAVARIKTAHLEKKYKLVVVDYLQLLDSRLFKKSGYEELAKTDYIIRRMRQMAVDLDLPVMLLCQFSKAGDDHEIPQMHHMKGSSSIHQHSDGIIFLYKSTEFVNAKNDFDRPVDYFIDVVKNRGGRTGAMPVVFDKKHFLFYEKQEQNNYF